MEQRQFEQASAEVRRQVVATARSYGIDGDDAEDVAQDVMLRLWTVRADLPDESSLQALAFVAARNRSIDFLRAHRTIPLDGIGEPHDQASPHDQLEQSETIRWLEQKLAELPVTEYEVLRLRQVERKSHDEIAAILGIQRASVSTLLARARKRLLQDIQKRNRQ